ncbi:MAG TPA: DUF5667 domain-containing protein [Nocardioides sp.]|nr:DUF5667 domain-containing protein [Nocardioides sp.]
MSPLFATRRRAEEFDAVVEEAMTRGEASDSRYDDLLALVGALRAVPQPQARPEYVAELRAALVAEAATMPARDLTHEDRLRLRTPDPGRVRNPRERGARIAVAGLALVGATATLSVVAQSALPGDLLYPLKRGIESAEAGLRVSEQGKGTTLLASATTRLDEVSRLDAEDHPAEIADTLDDFTAQATEASDLLLSSYAAKGDDATVVDLRSFTGESMTSLSELDGQLPDSAQDEWVHAVTTLVRIDDEAQLACPTCAGTDLDEIAPSLPTVGTGFGTGALPAVNVPDIVLPTLVLPSLGAGDLPPGSVTKPSPTAGPGGGPTTQPTGDPTTLPTGVPTTGVPTSAVPTAVRPTAAATSGAVVLPSVDLTQLIDDLTGGPSLLPVDLPSVDITALLGGVVGSVLPTPVTDPLGDLLDP